jgi:hypothetical protein
MRAGLVPMLHGSPAMGKSSIVKQIAEDFNLELIDLRLSQCDPTDLLGFPFIDKEAGKAQYVPMATFPIEGDTPPAGKAGWLLFLDEINSADRATQKAAYKLVLDKMVGMEKLHSSVALMAAGNLATDNAIVEEMGTALQSRMVHIEATVNHKDWIEWADAQGIDHKIISFINFKPTLLYSFDPDHSDKTFASPRTWEFADKLLKAIPENDSTLRPLIIGTIGEGPGAEFLSFCRVYGSLPTLDQLLIDPENAPLSTEVSVMYAMTGFIAHNINESNAQALMTYVSRMSLEFQIITIRSAIRIEKSILTNEAVQNWISRNQSELS